MIKDIVKDTFILSQKSIDATIDDLYIVQDLLDTIQFHQQHCIGMAANMIGELKKIIVFEDGGKYSVMINPEIIKTGSHMYETDESCLSLEGTKHVKRYDKIKVEYYDVQWKKKIKTYNGLTAQIIQHEIDHCQGILI